MGQATQPYKRSLSGSIGAGMKSIMGNVGKNYYVLEHKVSSKYHKRGEIQEIIIDEIELGRNPKCQVRFDEAFATVSRRHAAILKDGDNWKLVQLSKTNSTYLNGIKITNEWYLQNGDEIQLSTNGPKLGFIIPEGDKGKVSSIPLSRRLSLFGKQAMRPYKNAITVLSIVLMLCIGGGGYTIWQQNESMNDIAEQYKNDRIEYNSTIQEMRAKQIADSTSMANIKIESQREISRLRDEIVRQKQEFSEMIANAEAATPGTYGLSALIQSQGIEKDVYFLFTEKVCVVENGEEKVIPNYSWTGTGFLLNDGRFVTARHCVEGWLYGDPTQADQSILISENTPNSKIKAYFKAISSLSRNVFEFTSEDFTINRNLDKRVCIGNLDNGTPIHWTFTYPAMEGMNEKMWATDWAYARTSVRGNLKASSHLSKNLAIQQSLVVLGFPVNLGVNDGPEQIQPIASEVKVSRSGLANNGCILHSSGTDHGNSGGPIFAVENNKLVVIGIVSRGDIRTEQHNWAIPICNIQ